jgi:hypothetical protein
MKNPILLKFLSFFYITFILIIISPAAFAIGNSIVAVDVDGTTGQYTALVLDSQGYPTMSYYDASEGKLKVAHCFEKNCALFNSIVTPDGGSLVGKYTSIAFDKNGNPVISYYDETNSALKVLHCGNSTCSTGNTIATPDSTGTVGQYTSITVDKNNFPVVSFYDVTAGVLKVLHCGNSACSAGNSIVKPDLSSSNGVQSSIKLNASGNPVIAYFDFTHSSLKMLICGNANCSAGNTITTIDSSGDVGRYPSMVLDSNGNPAVSYLDAANGKLKILRCGNAFCTAGNTFASIGNNGIVGYFSSLALDIGNNPTVSFWDRTNGDLNVLRCSNASCSMSNTITIPDSAGNVGMYTSLKLDANSNPVISYYDSTNGDLKVLHCGSTTCGINSTTVADKTSQVGQFSAIKLDSQGNPIVSYWDETNGDLKVLHCGDNTCNKNNVITSAYTPGNTGWDTSLVIDGNGNPVISFYDFTNSVMKLLHCTNINCTGANSPISPDVFSHRFTSIALDAAGNPVIASAGPQDQGLRIVHCGNATCSAGNIANSPDFPGFPFNADVRGVSLTLDISGNPVVSFYRGDQNQLKVLHCVDAACTGPGNSIAVLDPGTVSGDHRSTSITLDATGNPVIAYQDTAHHALKVLHCGNPNCTSGNNIASPVTNSNGSTGLQPSIKIDTVTGNPIVSFGTDNTMSVLYCGNPNCTANNLITAVDPSSAGWDSAMTLDANGFPVASYYHSTGKNLKVLHCATKSCQ